jgi:hypothetical protein
MQVPLLPATRCESGYGSTHVELIEHVAEAHPCEFKDIYSLLHKRRCGGCPTANKVDKLNLPSDAVYAVSSVDLEAPPPLDETRRKFLMQICGCLMACPIEVPLPVTQYVISAVGRAMGHPSIKVSVGLRVSLISPNTEDGGAGGGGDGGIMLVTAATPKPVMRNLAELIFLVNAYLDIPGGPNQART